jgi:hypothetical protein
VEGEIVEISIICIKVLVQAQAPERLGRLGERCWLGFDRQMGCTIRRIPRPEIDPLDVEYDGSLLRDLLWTDAVFRHESSGAGVAFAGAQRCDWATPVQRAAISSHWASQLRAKVAASSAVSNARAPSIMIDFQDEP